jgi:hypothetical protein
MMAEESGRGLKADAAARKEQVLQWNGVGKCAI